MRPDTEQMLRDIEAEIRYTRAMIGRDRFASGVMQAMADVPRHQFVPDHERGYAYANGPLPIGFGQTISQPYIVALMTDLLDCGERDRVLEIGTGSGYQAAILSRVVGEVYSVEVVPELAERAHRLLARLGYDNVTIRCADGYFGWPEHAPYDGVLVTAAAPSVPPALIEQLKEGARLVIPVGPQYGHQELLVIEKRPGGSVRTTNVLSVAFVPLTRRRDRDRPA
jgi:protein-L-isoaspartate(D-aspartate) O-methyltransferase